MKTNNLISNTFSVKKELLTCQFVFHCKGCEEGGKDNDLPNNRTVSREHMNCFSAIRLQYYLTGRACERCMKETVAAHTSPKM